MLHDSGIFSSPADIVHSAPPRTILAYSTQCQKIHITEKLYVSDYNLCFQHHNYDASHCSDGEMHMHTHWRLIWISSEGSLKTGACVIKIEL